MAHFRGQRAAFGAPGFEPCWTDADKDGIGAAYSTGGRVWFTTRRGILTEVYYPTIDRPQLRDMQFLFADGKNLFLEEKRDFEPVTVRMEPSQGYKIVSHDRERKVSLTKEIIVEPSRPCILMHATLDGNSAVLKTLKAYVLCAPHLEGGGANN